MLILFTLLLLSVSSIQTCDNVVLNETSWQSLYPTLYHYQGFSRADGYLTLYAPNGAILLAPVNLIGSVFHQYFNSAGLMVADLFLGGLIPGVLIQATRQITNPEPNGKLCQKFLISTLAPELLISFSEITPSGINYMSSAYYSSNPLTLDRVFSNEIFNVDGISNSSFSQTNSYILGFNSITNYMSQSVYFKYSPITEAEAIALGYNPLNVMP